jgi:hypothetical protein
VHQAGELGLLGGRLRTPRSNGVTSAPVGSLPGVPRAFPGTGRVTMSNATVLRPDFKAMLALLRDGHLTDGTRDHGAIVVNEDCSTGHFGWALESL